MSIADFVGTKRIGHKNGRMSVSDTTRLTTARWTDRRPAVRRGEILRKTLHMFPGFLPFAMALLPHGKVLQWPDLLIIIACTVALTLLYIRVKKVVQRPDEKDFYSTCFSYPVSILATLILFPNHPEFACVVAVVLAFGDGSAYIGGKLFGKQPLPWNPEKTWAGSLCFVAVAAPIASLGYFLEANVSSFAYWGNGGPIHVPIAMAALCGTVAALTASLAESWKTRITDNLRVGVAASASVVATHYLTAGWFLL